MSSEVESAEPPVEPTPTTTDEIKQAPTPDKGTPTEAGAASFPPNEKPDGQPDETTCSKQPPSASETTTPAVESDNSKLLRELQDEVQSLRSDLREKEKSHEEALAKAKRSTHLDASAQDRTLKRHDSVALQQARERERQMVKQGTELAKQRKEISSLKEEVASLTSQLADGQRKIEIVETTTSGKEAASDSIAKLSQGQLKSAQLAVAELEKRVAEGEARETDLMAKLTEVQKELGEEKAKNTAASIVATRSPTQPAPPAITSAAANSAQQPGSRESVRTESIMRAKDKQIVTQSTEIARLRGDLERFKKQSSTLETQLASTAAQLKAEKATSERRKEEIEEITQLAEGHSASVGSLSTEKDALTRELLELRHSTSGMAGTLARLEKETQEYHSFKAAHLQCGKTLEDNRVTITKLEKDSKELHDEVSSLKKDLAEAQKIINEKEKALTEQHEVYAKVSSKHSAQQSALTADLNQQQSTVTDLRKVIREKEEEIEKSGKNLKQNDAQWEKKIAQLQKEMQELKDSASVGQANAKSNHQQIEAKLLAGEKRCEELQTAVSNAEQQRKTAEAQVQQLTQELSDRRAAALKLTQDVEDGKQTIQHLERLYNIKCDEVETLISQLHDLEGNEGTDTSSKRFIGLLESLSVEVCTRLAKGVSGSYMYGAPHIVTSLAQMMFIPEEVSAEVVLIMCRLYFEQRYGGSKSLQQVAATIGLPEGCIRRIASAFARVNDTLQPTPRRTVLQKHTPVEALHTFAGSERRALLSCLFLGGKKSKTNSLQPICDSSDSRYLASLMCSYLPAVVRGGTAFAVHSLQIVRNHREGHTALIAFSPDQGAFSLMECQVTSKMALVAIISGRYRHSQSHQSPNSVKLNLVCDAKREGVCHAPALNRASNEDLDTANPSSVADNQGGWKWAEEEAIPEAEAPSFQYIMQYDANHDGLQLKDSRSEDGGYPLRELSMREVASIQQLYGGELELSAMLSHRSWREVHGDTVE